MSEQINDGGPAFPVPVAQPFGDGWMAIGGMTLRDYFAAKIVCGAMAHPEMEMLDEDMTLVAKLCYRMADAMIAERNKKNQ